ncbi:MAG: hypothetical protein ACI9V8_000097 [Urechidicola sp.]|jgi:uncharacterized protein YbaP (TraB family)
MRLKRLLLFSLFASSICLSAFAGMPVWKVERNGSQIFIGGTVHLLTPADFPLPDAFDIAYQQSDKVIFEASLEDMEKFEFQASMMKKLSYSTGQSLKLALSEKTYQKLSRYCTKHNISMEGLLPFKPGMVSMILSITELQQLGFTGVGVDAFYNQKAKQDNKPMGALETVEQQLNFIAEMGKGQEDDLIIYTLNEMEKLPRVMTAMMVAWRNGDLDQLENVASKSLRKDFPSIHDELIVKRNNAWMPKIEALFDTTKVEFILVGSLHLSGKTGLIEQLKTRGYNIEMVVEPN